MAGSAGKHQAVVDTVFLRVEQVGAEMYPLANSLIDTGILRCADQLLTIRDRIENESDRRSA